MDKLLLPLRQRKLLNHLQHASGYVTGMELSRLLDVSSRTIRNDISEINRLLAGSGVEIASKHSFGYIIHAKNAENLKKLTQTSESFISRSERLHYMAQRLALSDNAIDLDDLADEMFISKTTLEYDLREFRRHYVQAKPFIRIQRHHNMIRLTPDERAQRKILCYLVCENWNYNGRGNTFFQYSFLDEKIVNTCIREISYYLYKHDIPVEDINIINLDLCVAIASERIRQGRVLTNKRKDLYLSPKATACADELLDSLQEKLDCSFNEIERDEIRELLACSLLPDMKQIDQNGIASAVPMEVIRLTNSYLTQVKDTYQLDFFDDDELYITLTLYLNNLRSPVHNLNTNGIVPCQIQMNYAIGFELAMLIQDKALDFYGHYLIFDELFYLASIMECGLHRRQPPLLRTVILSQYNHPMTWAIRMMVEKRFPLDIKVTNLLSMYQKDTFDFTNTDLILCTTNKTITSDTKAYQIKISPAFNNEDIRHIQEFLKKSSLSRLYQQTFPDTLALLEEARWNELIEINDYHKVLDYLGNRLIEDGYVGQEYLDDIHRHEKLLSYAVNSSFIIVHSPVPARKTHIEVGTMLHRLKLDSGKVRLIMMVCTTPKDRSLIFKLYNEFYLSHFDPQAARFLMRKEEYLNFFRNHMEDAL